MKTLLIPALLLLLPLTAHAECSPVDFSIKEFKTNTTGSGAAIRLSLSGELVNNCATASAAQIRIDAKNDKGEILQTKKGWPAGTANIAPGETAKFDLGRMFRFQSDMISYTVSVVSARAW